MEKFLEVKKDIYWVGALDHKIKIFDIIMETKYGTTYNSYVVKGKEKTALVEVSKERFFDEFLGRVNSVCDPKEIDYIIINHTEPDHTGALKKLLEVAPNACVVASQIAIKFLKEILNQDFKHQVVKPNDTIDLGGKTLKFVQAQFLHWPDSMFTYLPEDKTLFSCDSFGCHYCNELVFNDLLDENSADFYDAYKYYFDCIISPFKSYMLTALDNIKDLEIETICPGHGPVIRKDIQKYLDMYKEWSTVEARVKPSIVIPYVTAYGYTKKIALKIEEGIKSVGKVDVFMFDLVEDSKEDCMKEINEATGILFGSPTLIGDALPPILEILISLNPIIHKGKFAGAFGSYGWSGEAVDNISARLKQLRFKTPIEPLKICFNPSDEQLQSAFEFGKKFAEAIVG